MTGVVFVVPIHSNVNGPIPPETATLIEAIVPQAGWTIVGVETIGMKGELDVPGVGTFPPEIQTFAPSHSL